VAFVAKTNSTKETITKKTPTQEQFLEDLLCNITKGYYPLNFIGYKQSTTHFSKHHTCNFFWVGHILLYKTHVQVENSNK
jgi:hypothetical protein